MTSKEKEILEIIKENPTIEQSAIAKLLNIKRSTVGVHISSLQKQGYLLGKGYIVNDDKYIVGIGACNVDVYGKSHIKLKKYYDHPAKMHSSIGGVTYNIIANYNMLNGNGKLITAYSDDIYGRAIVDRCCLNRIDINDSLMVKNTSSGIFVQIQDDNNDMHLAVCDMSILKHLDVSFIQTKKNIIRNAKCVVLDPSLNDDTILEIIRICDNDVPIYVDPISDNYALKMRKYLKDLTLIKPNKSELESLTSIKINDNDSLIKAARKVLDKGTKKIVVSLGKDGILYMDDKNCIKKKIKEDKKMKNASGAGDALMAGLLYGLINDLGLNQTLDYGLAAGIAAIRSESTINENMSLSLLEEILKEKKK